MSKLLVETLIKEFYMPMIQNTIQEGLENDREIYELINSGIGYGEVASIIEKRIQNYFKNGLKWEYK